MQIRTGIGIILRICIHEEIYRDRNMINHQGKYFSLVSNVCTENTYIEKMYKKTNYDNLVSVKVS